MSTEPHHKVERFWRRMSDSDEVSYDSGWLVDPYETFLGSSVNAAALQSNAFSQQRCVALLGELGMGKSHVLQDLIAEEPAAIGAERTIAIDLAECTSELLLRDAFERPAIKSWLEGTESAVLYLDSFDEARVHVPSLGNQLTSRLDGWPLERLHLRIGCRIAEWPSALRARLAQLFDDDVEEYELLPLRRVDALPVLNGSQQTTFLDHVDAVGLGALASRPITLRLIAHSFEATGKFPSNVAAAYEQGLLAMSEEFDLQRRENQAAAGIEISGEDRLRAATSLAAVLTFVDRSSIWMGPDATTPPNAVRAQEYDEVAAVSEVPARVLGVGGIHQAVRSGLFKKVGESSFTWSHASFGDYLAARWMSHRTLSEAQVRQLMLAEDGYIVPQLQHVAAWLVAIDSETFGWLVDADPEAFLLGIDIPSDELRSRVVEGMLRLAREGDLLERWRGSYGQLVHPGVTAQLQEVLVTSESEDEQYTAIVIARNCMTTDLTDVLAEVGLDETCSKTLRVAALMAIHTFEGVKHQAAHGFESILTESEPFLSPAWSTYDLELAGAALICLWPKQISTETALSYMVPGHPRSFYGLYVSFIFELARGLTSADLDVALEWAKSHSEHLDDFRLRPVTDAIVALACRNLTVPAARSFVVSRARHLAQNYEPLFDNLTDPPVLLVSERRELAAALLAGGDAHTAVALVKTAGSEGLQLLDADDLAWLMDLYLEAAPEDVATLKVCIRLLFDPNRLNHVALLLELPPDHPVRSSVLGFWLTPVVLGSHEAEEMKEAHFGFNTFAQRRADREAANAWVNPKIESLAKSAAEGDLESFWVACRHIHMRPGTATPVDEFQPDLTKHPRWDSLSEKTQGDMLSAAPQYLENAKCEPSRWLTLNKRLFPAEAGYQALILLLKGRPDQLDELSPSAWREWAPIIVSWTCSINGASWDDKRELIQRARPHATEELEQALLTLVEAAERTDGSFWYQHESAELWSERIRQRLLAAISKSGTAATREQLLETLLKLDDDRLMPILVEWVSPTSRAVDRDRAIMAARNLVRRASTPSWPVIVRLISEDPDFMEAVFLGLGMDRNVPELEAADLGDLLTWLLERFPPELDPKEDDAHIVGDREHLAQWRDAILRSLGEDGRPGSVPALKAVVAAAPQYGWLRRYLPIARRAHRLANWNPPSSRELADLARNDRAVLVRSSEELLQSVLVALARIQGRISGDTPEAPWLWDVTSRLPNAEEYLSDYLKNRLSEVLNASGVIVNREVQVSRPSRGLGDRTDIRVDAVRHIGHPDADVLTVVIEVKGCWYRDIVGRLTTQLVDRYMTPIGTDRGIYLIFWFDISQWNEADDRRTVAARRTPTSIDQELAPSLQKLWADGVQVSVVHLDGSL